jgi:hypothetical protein
LLGRFIHGVASLLYRIQSCEAVCRPE